MRVRAASLRQFALTAALLGAAAAGGVARGGEDKPRAIAAIEDDLVADDAAVRARAAAELTDRFPDGAVAVPMLVDLLDDEDAAVVAAAAKAIVSMAIAGAVPLAAWCADPARWRPDAWFASSLRVGLRNQSRDGVSIFDRERRRRGLPPTRDELAMSALFPSHDVVPWLVTAFEDASAENRPLAASALAARGADVLWSRKIALPARSSRSPSASVIGGMLASDSDPVAWTGARLAALVRSADPDIIKPLIGALSAPKAAEGAAGDQDAGTHSIREACRALGRIGDESAARALLAIASSHTESVDASVALLRMGMDADLLKALSREPVRSNEIVLAFAVEGRAVDAVVRRLIQQLELRAWMVAVQLRDLGPSAAAALPALKRQMLEGDKRFTPFYAEAVLAVAPDDVDALRFWFAACADPETETRAITVLAERAAPAPGVVTVLLEFLAREARDPGVYDPGVIDGVARLGAAAGAGVDDLLALAKRTEEAYGDFNARPRLVRNRRSITVALGRIGPDAAAAVPALTALRDKGDETIRVPAAQALRRIRAKK